MTELLTRLDNGLTVVTRHMSGLETAAVALVADAGSRHEDAPENGLAHFYEHMVFKGTAQRSARHIAETIENVGGSLNAWTSRDTTCFHGRVLAEHVPLAIELIAQLITDPLFAEHDIDLEKQVVLSEISEAADMPDDRLFDHLQALAFPGQSLGRPVLGTADSLEPLAADALHRWRQRNYCGDGLVLAAAGKIDHQAIVAIADRLLGRLPHGRPGPVEVARWGGGQQLDARPGEQLHLAIGFQGFAPQDERQMAARLFAMALGGGMSSRLFQQLREEQGLAYSVGASHGLHADTGLFSIYAATRPEQGSAVLEQARRIAETAAHDLTDAELQRAKAQLKSGLMMALESCAAQADWLAGSLLTWGRVLPEAELLDCLDRMSLEQVREAGATMLATAPALAAVGPQAESLSC